MTIPESVTAIGKYAFADCENLRDVILYAEQVPTTQPEVFNDTPISQAILHVPAASVDAHKAAVPWNNFKIVVAIK